MLGGRYKNKFTPLLEEILRWRDIIGDNYKQSQTYGINNSQ